MKNQTTRQSDAPRFAQLFNPKFITVLREGYGLTEMRADAIAGLNVAIIALPFSMAIERASGATPAQGLYTAIVGCFFVSLLGGSRFKIGGPAGAFTCTNRDIENVLATHGLKRPLAHYAITVDEALTLLRERATNDQEAGA